jgi:hypothetical protein
MPRCWSYAGVVLTELSGRSKARGREVPKSSSDALTVGRALHITIASKAQVFITCINGHQALPCTSPKQAPTNQRHKPVHGHRRPLPVMQRLLNWRLPAVAPWAAHAPKNALDAVAPQCAVAWSVLLLPHAEAISTRPR